MGISWNNVLRRTARVGTVVPLALLVSLPATAGARPKRNLKPAPTTRLVFKQFNVAGGDTDGGPNHQPYAVVRGPDGNMWFATIGQYNEIGTAAFGRITPTGTTTFFPDPNRGVIQDLADGFAGNVWFTDIDQDDNTLIGNLSSTGQVTNVAPGGSGQIVHGPGGKLWFVGGGIESIDANGNVSSYPVPQIWTLHTLVEGADGNIWFTAVRNVDSPAWDDIGRMTPTGSITMFRIPTFNAVPDGITLGPDGNVWFGEHKARIGRITPAGKITEFQTHLGFSGIGDLITGPDGNMWFTDGGQQAIGRITTSGKITEFPVPRPAVGFGTGLAFGNRNTLWFTDKDQGVIGRATIVTTR